MRFTLIFLTGLLLFMILPTSAVRTEDSIDDQYCGMLPKEVTNATYAGWSACKMKKAGEKPLWKGLATGEKQVMRFTFTQGHGMFYRVVRIVERDDGTAELKVFGTHNRNHYKKPERAVRTRHENLSVDQLELIDRLASESGVWEFEVGTWDQNAGENGDEMEIYMHCQVLEMERANADGFRFSSVNIGCNQPTKLMPLVNEIVRLGDMKNTHNDMLFE